MRAKLKAAREAKGLTRQQVAKYLGITDVAYGRVELGQRIGRVEMWDKLEDLFGIHQRQLREVTVVNIHMPTQEREVKP